MSTQTKPPAGILPKHIWQETRVRDLDAAIGRRLGTKHPVPQEWLDERAELLAALRAHALNPLFS